MVVNILQEYLFLIQKDRLNRMDLSENCTNE